MLTTATTSKVQLADKLQSWAQQLADISKAIRNESDQDSPASDHRGPLLRISHDMSKEVQQPGEQIMGCLTTLAQLTALMLLINWKALDAIPLDGAISYQDVAARVGADASLLRRISWMLVATGMLQQVGGDKIAHTETTKAYVHSIHLRSLLRLGFDQHIRCFLSMPDYFDEYGRNEPTERRGTIFAYAAGDPSLTMWETLNRNPAKMANFMNSMEGIAKTMPIMGSYDFSWLAARAQEYSDRALLVDVGGGKGHALETICKATPGLPTNRCVVEDLPEVAEAAKKAATGPLASAQFVGMDFHKEQTVRGAAVYYIRRCLHDYGDDVSVGILQHIQGAMALDSRLLIVEDVLSNPPSAMASTMDIMMATIGGKERTLENFGEIVGRAGLTILGVHPSEGSGVCVVECARADSLAPL